MALTRLPLRALLLCFTVLLCTGGGSAAGALPTSTALTAPVMPAPVDCPGCWHPPLEVSWEWQLSSVPKPPFLPVQVYDIDGFAASPQVVADLHTSLPGRRVICYLSTGSWESWRPDAKQFPKAVKGRPLDGWPGERWVDIRRFSGRLGTIMRARLDMCAAKGFDAVEFDNADGYLNRTGFALKGADQLAYNAWLANEAHARGLSAVLKNDLPQIPKLLPYYDMALSEQCWQYAECTTAQNGGFGLDQFVEAGKPVFHVEYQLPPKQFCARSNRQNFNSLRKRLALGAYRVPCRGS
ncbi:MAG: hypothetical protein QOJ13_1026 [Gaiellales bacterium]|jgi:hypothetical protein|nr:hypothetical protein [Gaiellales bacterium]